MFAVNERRHLAAIFLNNIDVVRNLYWKDLSEENSWICYNFGNVFDRENVVKVISNIRLTEIKTDDSVTAWLTGLPSSQNLNIESVRDEGGSIVLTLKLKRSVTDWCFLTKMAEYSVMQ